VKTVLIVVFGPSHFREMSRVADLLAATSDYRPLVVFAYQYPEIELDRETARLRSLEWVDFRGPPPPPSITSPKAVAHYVRHLRRRLRLFGSFLDAHRPSLIVLPVDHVSGGMAEMIKAGHDRGVPSVIVPFSLANHEEALLAYGLDFNRSTAVWMNALVGALLPKWVISHGGRRVLREVGPLIVALELTGLAPPVPWMQNSGHADMVAVESGFMFDYCRRGGIAEDHMAVTGALYSDTLAEIRVDAEARREALYARLGLPPGRPMLLVSLPPPLQTATRDCEFVIHEQFIDAMARTAMGLSGWNTVFCRHPMLDEAYCAPIIDAGGVLSRDDTATLIPLARLYVASVSATIRWALVCGIPAINYDPFAHRYSEYYGHPAVAHVETSVDYAATVGRLTGAPAALRAMSDRLAQEPGYWGALDGGAGGRMLTLFDRLIDAAERAPSGSDRSSSVGRLKNLAREICSPWLRCD